MTTRRSFIVGLGKAFGAIGLGSLLPENLGKVEYPTVMFQGSKHYLLKHEEGLIETKYYDRTGWTPSTKSINLTPIQVDHMHHPDGSVFQVVLDGYYYHKDAGSYSIYLSGNGDRYLIHRDEFFSTKDMKFHDR